MLNTKYYGEENTLAGSTLTDEQLDAVAGGFNWPWDYLAYAACFAGGTAGGGDTQDVSDYCHDRYLD